MAEQTLTIGDITEISDDSLVLAVNFNSLEVRQKYIEKSFEDIKKEFKNKTIQFQGTNIQFETKVNDVEVSSSIADFRNIFLKIQKTPETSRLKIRNGIIIDL